MDFNKGFINYSTIHLYMNQHELDKLSQATDEGAFNPSMQPDHYNNQKQTSLTSTTEFIYILQDLIHHYRSPKRSKV